jgi:hypothetical protein
MDLLPLDVLKIIFHFMDTISDSLNIILLCRKWFNVLAPDEKHWKKLFLNLWTNSLRIDIDIEWVQEKCKKAWLW